MAIAACCAMVTEAPWTIRNRVVFGQRIPIKSNCVYEIWQAPCVDDDGVVDYRVFAQHPWSSSGPERDAYVAVGELSFIAAKWTEVRESVRAAPVDVVARAANRFLAATTWYPASERERGQGSWILYVKYAAFGLPFLGLLALLAVRPIPMEKPVLAAIAPYGLFLVPYVLISYYDRYGLPLLGVKMLLVLYGVDSAVGSLPSPWTFPRCLTDSKIAIC